jgi:outer membrane immunogenic protein
MKRLVLTGFALATLAISPAIAADMPVKAPILKAPPPGFSWTGFYIGANVGYGWGDGDTSFTPLPTAAGFANLAPTTLSPKPAGFLGGGQVGFNWQTGMAVWGLEADLDGSGITGSVTQSPIIQNNGTSFGAGSAVTASENLKWFGTVRGRLGFTPADRWLVYATGGLAYAQVNYAANSNFIPPGTQQYPANFTQTHTGWTAGGGVEWAFANNWSAKIEGLYYDLGNVSSTANGVPGLAAGACGSGPAFCQVGYTWKTTGEMVRGGLNFKLGGM